MLALAAYWDWRTALIVTGGVGLIVFAAMALRRDVLVGEERKADAPAEDLNLHPGWPC